MSADITVQGIRSISKMNLDRLDISGIDDIDENCLRFLVDIPCLDISYFMHDIGSILHTFRNESLIMEDIVVPDVNINNTTADDNLMQ